MAETQLLELCVRRAGGGLGDVVRGSRVCAFVIEWAVFGVENGRDPRNVEEWAVWEGKSSAYGWRRLRMFRELFPEYADPSPLAHFIRQRFPDRIPESEAQFIAVPLAA